MDPKAVPDSLTARFFDDPTVLFTTDPEEVELLNQFKTILASGESYRRVSAALAAKYRPAVESVYLEGTDTVAHLFMRYRPPQLPGVPADKGPSSNSTQMGVGSKSFGISG